MAKHRFHGYATKEEYEADSYDRDSDAAKNAPTLRQLIDVFEAAYEVNDLARLQKMVGKAMGPDLTGILRGWIANFIGTLLEQSRTSLSTSGDSPSESSTTTPETSEAPTELLHTVEDSPSLVSTAS